MLNALSRFILIKLFIMLKDYFKFNAFYIKYNFFLFKYK